MEPPNAALNNNMILTVINYQNQNYQYSTQLNKQLNTFYNELCNYFKTNPDENLLYYQNQQLKTKNNKTQLMNIIKLQDNSSYPYFCIIPNNSQNPDRTNIRYKTDNKHKQKQKRKLNLQSLSVSRDKEPFSNNISSINKTTDTSKNNITNNLLNHDFSVFINEIPSVNDIEIILNDFNLKNKNPNNNILDIENINNTGILTPISNNSIKITFQNEMLLNEFISYITYIKYENPYYKKIK